MIGRPFPPYVLRECDRHGRVRLYFRRGKGKRIALPDPRDREAFDRAYASALADVAPAPRNAASGTLEWLILRYKESGKFAALRPSTRRMRDNILKRVIARSGHVPFVDVRRRHVVEAMDSLKPHAANNFRKVMSQVFSWAVSIELVDTNPVAGVPAIRIKSDGFHTWTVAEVEQFRRRWPLGTRARLAMDLLLYTGLRRADVIVVGLQHISDGELSIRTQKTGMRVHLTIYDDLQASIDACRGGNLTLLTTTRNTTFSSPASFGNWFRKACIAANVPGRAHGLRKAGATIAADRGATVHMLMAMYGWTRAAQAEVYTRAADRRRLAAMAGARIANEFAPNPNPDDPNRAKKHTNTRGYK
ncbi:MAG: tyrosine-type recombinase/integrase [Notoacmeibacter sp.]|nr:tyrosine-type recombinase/integrase [Notoacmeibacter sp.]